MSNPVATISFSIPTPPDPQVTRKTYQRVVFEQQNFFTYGVDEYDPTYVAWDPSGKGDRFFIFVPLDNALGTGGLPPGVKPDFTTDKTWNETVKKSASAFLTARYSVMPKIFIPSLTLVDNGINSTGQAYFAYVNSDTGVEAFNWDLKTFNTNPVDMTKMIEYGQIGAYFGSQYISLRAKKDDSASNTLTLELNEPPVGGGSAPTGEWLGTLVTNGAFVILLNVVPSRPASVDYAQVQENQWSIKFTFGEVEMEMNAVGAMKVKIGSGVSTEQNTLTVNLAEGKTKEGPPQQEHIDDKQPYVILVYPVWNGIVVQSGVQESRVVVNSSSTYIPKLKEASVLESPYSAGFDPTAPDNVLVGVGSGATLVTVDMGTKLQVEAKNVKFELAYLPCYFSSQAWFDMWFIGNDNTPTIDYSYNIYTIWTPNNTTSTLAPAPTPTVSTFPGPVANTHYWYASWKLTQAKHNRYAGEIFGAVLEVIEDLDYPIKNDNGSFALSWPATGNQGDPSATSWEDYIQNITVTMSVDGTSGSITVDKYGVGGQDAVAIQSVGALNVYMSGGNGTQAGYIFMGLAMGIGHQEGSDGSTWTIPLVGLEQKINDILLINVPFMDGETVSYAMNFLCKYAGLFANYTYAPAAGTDNLSVSEDVNAPRFDWKSGTSVKSAMDSVMDDRQYNYVIYDGVVNVFELDAFGLPNYFNPFDWQSLYPDTKVVNVDETPELGVLRNDILVIALQGVPGGQGTNIQDVPTVPRFVRKNNYSTYPTIPWAKVLVRPITGVLSLTEMDELANKLKAETRHYKIVGRTTIPGNGNIRPYDKWGGYFIYSVTHNVDFTSKTWTTDLEFASS